MKRWTGAVAVAAVAGVAVWWLTPNSVDVAMITAIHPDGTIEWVEGEYRRLKARPTAVAAGLAALGLGGGLLVQRQRRARAKRSKVPWRR